MSKARDLADLLSDGVISAGELAEGAALPSQAGQSGKYLTTDGTDASWNAIQIGATILSVLNRAGTTIDVGLTAGNLNITNRSGTTVSVPVF